MESMKEELDKIISTYPCLSDLLESNPNRVYHIFDDKKVKGLPLFWKILYYAPIYPILFEFLYNNIQNFTKEQINEKIEDSDALEMCLAYSKTKYNPKIIRLLLKYSTSVKLEKNNYLRILIGNMDKNSDHKVLSLLIKYGCDVNRLEENGQTLLYNLIHFYKNHMTKKMVYVITFLANSNALLYNDVNKTSFKTFKKGNNIYFVLQNMENCKKNGEFCEFLKTIYAPYDGFKSTLYSKTINTIKENYKTGDYKNKCLFLTIHL